MGLQGGAHGADVLRRGAAAAADDTHPGVKRQAGIVGHQFRRAGVVDLTVHVFRDAAVALGDQHVGGVLGLFQVEDGSHQLRGAGAAVAAEGDGARFQFVSQGSELCRRHPHHGPPVGVEGEGDGVGQGGGLGAHDGGLHLVDGGDGLDPGEIGAAGGEALGLLGEGRCAFLDGQRPQRLKEIAGRAHGAGDDHVLPSAFRDGAVGQLGGGLVDLEDLVLGAVQLQPVGGAAEGVGEDDVRAGVDEGAVVAHHIVRALQVPELRRVAVLQAHGEEVGAGCTVGQQPGAGFQQVGQAVGHKRFTGPSDVGRGR